MNCFYHLSNSLSSRLVSRRWCETNLLLVNLIKSQCDSGHITWRKCLVLNEFLADTVGPTFRA